MGRKRQQALKNAGAAVRNVQDNEEHLPPPNVQSSELTTASEEGAIDSIISLLEDNEVAVVKIVRGDTFTFNSIDECKSMYSLAMEVCSKAPRFPSRITSRKPAAAVEFDATLVVNGGENGVTKFLNEKLWFPFCSQEEIGGWSDAAEYAVKRAIRIRQLEQQALTSFADFLKRLERNEERITTGDAVCERPLLCNSVGETINGSRLVIEHTMGGNMFFKLTMLEKKLVYAGMRELAKRGETLVESEGNKTQLIEKIREAAKSAVSLVIFSTTGFRDVGEALQSCGDAYRRLAQTEEKFPILRHYLAHQKIALFIAPTFYSSLKNELMREMKRLKEEFKGELNERINDLKQEIKGELNERISDLKKELKEELIDLRTLILQRLPPLPLSEGNTKRQRRD